MKGTHGKRAIGSVICMFEFFCLRLGGRVSREQLLWSRCIKRFCLFEIRQDPFPIPTRVSQGFPVIVIDLVGALQACCTWTCYK